MTRVEAESIAGIILVGAGLLVGRDWLQEHDARVKAEQTTTTQAAVMKQADATYQSALSDLKSRIDQLESQKAQAVTPAQWAALIHSNVPGVTPTILTIPQPANAQGQPQPPVLVGQIPADQLKVMSDFTIACQECQAKLTASQAETTKANADLVAMTKTAKGWEDAAKGGTLWHRVRHDLLTAGVSIGVFELVHMSVKGKL